MSVTVHSTYVQTRPGGFFASCQRCGSDPFPDRSTLAEAEADARSHGQLEPLSGGDPFLATLRPDEYPLTTRQAEELSFAQFRQAMDRHSRQHDARIRLLLGVVWFDFDPEGLCPLCGKSLSYASEDVGRPGPDHASCGSYDDPHFWLVYWRKAKLGATPGRMRLLKRSAVA